MPNQPVDNLGSLLEDELVDKSVWDYHIYSPLSMQDDACVRVVISYGDKSMEVHPKCVVYFDLVRRK